MKTCPAPEVIPFRVGQRLSTLEREAIRQTLLAVGGNREAAASILGIGKATLYRRLREMEADAEKDAERDKTTSEKGNTEKAKLKEAKLEEAKLEEAKSKKVEARAGREPPRGDDSKGDDSKGDGP